jgi:toxin ParE1/3/4
VSRRIVVPREHAERDVDEAIAYYLTEGGERAAIGFVDALERACEQIGDFPSSGSPRHAHELDLPGLLSWPFTPHPYVVFCVEDAERVDVWRVLHAHRDIPAWLREGGGS